MNSRKSNKYSTSNSPLFYKVEFFFKLPDMNFTPIITPPGVINLMKYYDPPVNSQVE